MSRLSWFCGTDRDKVLLIGNSGLPGQDFLKINPVELFSGHLTWEWLFLSVYGFMMNYHLIGVFTNVPDKIYFGTIGGKL